MKIVAYDLEVTGLKVDECHILELAYIIADVKKKQILKMVTHLIKPDSDFEVTKEIEEITGISKRAVLDYGKSFSLVIDEMHMDVLPPFDEQCEYMIGHNCTTFDKPILDRYIDTYSKDKFMPQEYRELKKLKIIDTMTDLPIPESIKTRKLTHLCFEHGIVMMPAHRAIVDCLMTAQLLFKYDFDEVAKRSQESKHVLAAQIGGPWQPEFNQRKQLAVANGFRWNPDQKIWAKTVRESELKNQYPFEVKIL